MIGEDFHKEFHHKSVHLVHLIQGYCISCHSFSWTWNWNCQTWDWPVIGTLVYSSISCVLGLKVQFLYRVRIWCLHFHQNTTNSRMATWWSGDFFQPPIWKSCFLPKAHYDHAQHHACHAFFKEYKCLFCLEVKIFCFLHICTDNDTHTHVCMVTCNR